MSLQICGNYVPVGCGVRISVIFMSKEKTHKENAENLTLIRVWQP